MLPDSLPGEARPEDPRILAWQVRTTLRRVLEAKYAALQRVNAFDAIRRPQPEQQLPQSAHGSARCRRAAQQGLHVLGGVIERPSLVIDRLPLPGGHSGVGGASVLRVVLVEVWIHHDAVRPKRLVVLRAGQRRQTEE